MENIGELIPTTITMAIIFVIAQALVFVEFRSLIAENKKRQKRNCYIAEFFFNIVALIAVIEIAPDSTNHLRNIYRVIMNSCGSFNSVSTRKQAKLITF